MSCHQNLLTTLISLLCLRLGRSRAPPPHHDTPSSHYRLGAQGDGDLGRNSSNGKQVSDHFQRSSNLQFHHFSITEQWSPRRPAVPVGIDQILAKLDQTLTNLPEMMRGVVSDVFNSNNASSSSTTPARRTRAIDRSIRSISKAEMDDLGVEWM